MERPDGKSPRRPPKVRLDMTSLMDVMFLVLVFFVYAVFDMSVHRGVKVDLPTAAGSLEKGERIVVTVRADDALQLNGRDLTRAELVENVRRLAAADAAPPVLVAGDAKASFGTGIGLMAELKAAGVKRISVQVSGKGKVKP